MSTSLWPAGVSFNNGVLHISGISAQSLAKDFATPAFFIDEDDFRARAMGWNKALNQSRRCNGISWKNSG